MKDMKMIGGMYATEKFITFSELIDLFLANIRIFIIFTLVAFSFGILAAIFRSPVYESRALLEVPANQGAADSLLSKIGGLGAGISDNSELQNQQYILTSRSVLEGAVTSQNLQIVATPWFFPVIGRAFSNHATKYDDLSLVHPPVLWLSRYNWGGGNINIAQFDIPEALIDKNFTLKYLGNQEYELDYQHKTFLKGRVGVLSQGQLDNQPIKCMVSSLFANPGAFFTVKKENLLGALGQLKSQTSVAVPAMGSTLLSVSVKGGARDALQARLTALINSASQTSVRTRIEKAKNVLSFLQSELPVIKNRINQLNDSMQQTMPIGTQFDAMSQEKSIQSSLYSGVLMDIEQYQLEKASSLGNLSVLTPPTPI